MNIQAKTHKITMNILVSVATNNLMQIKFS